MRRTLAAAAVGALVVAAVATARSASPVPGGIVELGRDSSVVVLGSTAKAKAGIVVSQRPRAGTTLSPSAKISLVVSRGPR